VPKFMKFLWLFHGTSSRYQRNIEANGLLPINCALHLTTHPCIALLEAERTTRGDEATLYSGYKQPVFGTALIVKVPRAAALGLRLDPEYYDRRKARGYRLVTSRAAFITGTPIGPEHVSLLDLAEFEQVIDEIDAMAKLPPFEYECRTMK
jgi:hypothetical protein